MTGAIAWAIVFGALGGLGLWSLTTRVPRLSRPSLLVRIAPSLADVSAEARRVATRRSVDPLPVLGGLLSPLLPVLQRGAGALSGRFGGGGPLAVRLARAGRADGSERRYRLEQLLWVATGLVLSIAASVWLLRGGTVPAALLPLVVVIGAVVGAWGCEANLSREIAARRRLIAEELPAVLEFLGLSLSAGESLVPGLRRVADTASGALPAELGRAAREIAAGAPIDVALRALAERVDLPAVDRLVGQLVAALERGTPLAAVLAAQAEDARVEQRRTLMESAGKREIAMMVPLVFLILPISVALAIFPGVIVLYTGF